MSASTTTDGNDDGGSAQPQPHTLSLAEKCIELIKELQRKPDAIPAYNSDCVRRVLDEVAELVELNRNDVAVGVVLTNCLISVTARFSECNAYSVLVDNATSTVA